MTLVMIAIASGLSTMCWCFILDIGPTLKRIAIALEKIAKERT